MSREEHFVLGSAVSGETYQKFHNSAMRKGVKVSYLLRQIINKFLEEESQPGGEKK